MKTERSFEAAAERVAKRAERNGKRSNHARALKSFSASFSPRLKRLSFFFVDAANSAALDIAAASSASPCMAYRRELRRRSQTRRRGERRNNKCLPGRRVSGSSTPKRMRSSLSYIHVQRSFDALSDRATRARTKVGMPWISRKHVPRLWNWNCKKKREERMVTSTFRRKNAPRDKPRAWIITGRVT